MNIYEGLFVARTKGPLRIPLVLFGAGCQRIERTTCYLTRLEFEFLALNVEVLEWQFGQRILKLSILLLDASPSIWSNSVKIALSKGCLSSHPHTEQADPS